MKLTRAVILFCSLVSLSCSLRPLLFIHGLTDSYTSFDIFESYLKADFPGIKVFSLNAFNGNDSDQPIGRQIQVFSQMVRNITDEYGDVTLVGHSQGAFISRSILQTTGNPHIHTLISMAAPGVGNYGAPKKMEMVDLKFVRSVISKLCYDMKILWFTKRMLRGIVNKAGRLHHLFTRLLSGQEVSLCGYWRDPTPEFYSIYLNKSKILPYLNNEVPHINAEKYKSNFLNVRRLILAGGPDDGVVIPWQSTQYGYYDENLRPIALRDYFLYKNDTFGLKSLDERNGLITCTVHNVTHIKFHRERKVYEKCVKPYVA